tara:strand:+ start:69 stop:260 length:192 start_codon:yes stop_codon:yes gene_type:complete
MDNLYGEMLLMRDQLLNRIELLEDEVEYLTQENTYYSKQMYQLEVEIDTISEQIKNLNNSERP